MTEAIRNPNIENSPALALPDREPDNRFFEDETDGHARGRSWNVAIEGLRATIGKIEAGTVVEFSVDAPEVLLVHDGEILTGEPSGADTAGPYPHPKVPTRAGSRLALPVNRDFKLTVPGESDLVYTCFYPTNANEMIRIEDIARRTDHPNTVYQTLYPLVDAYPELDLYPELRRKHLPPQPQ